MRLKFHVQQRTICLAPIMRDLPIPLETIATKFIPCMSAGMCHRVLEEAASFARFINSIRYDQCVLNKRRIPESMGRPCATQIIYRQSAGCATLRSLEMIQTRIVKLLE